MPREGVGGRRADEGATESWTSVSTLFRLTLTRTPLPMEGGIYDLMVEA